MGQYDLVMITIEIIQLLVLFEVQQWQVTQKLILGTRELMLIEIQNIQRYGENYILGLTHQVLVQLDGMYQQIRNGLH